MNSIIRIPKKNVRAERLPSFGLTMTDALKGLPVEENIELED